MSVWSLLVQRILEDDIVQDERLVEIYIKRQIRSHQIITVFNNIFYRLNLINLTVEFDFF